MTRTTTIAAFGDYPGCQWLGKVVQARIEHKTVPSLTAAGYRAAPIKATCWVQIRLPAATRSSQSLAYSGFRPRLGHRRGCPTFVCRLAVVFIHSSVSSDYGRQLASLAYTPPRAKFPIRPVSAFIAIAVTNCHSPLFGSRRAAARSTYMPLVMGLSALASALHQTLSAPFYRSPSISQGSADFPPRLPLELCEAIIDYCSNDLCTLRACTLVCHAWVRRAQKHIFSRTCLRTSKLRFTQTLLTANPTLAAYIQHLTVDFGGTDTLVNVRDMLKSVCQHMESVQALRLTGISLPASLELNLLRTVLPKRTTRLELGKITVAPQAPLPALIASFPLLQDLSLGENLSSVYGAATWVAAGPITVRLRAPLQTLRLSLAFSNPAVLNYAQWLAAGPHTLDLRTLCVAFDYSGTRINAPATLGLLLDTLGPPLETLELAMARDTDLNGEFLHRQPILALTPETSQSYHSRSSAPPASPTCISSSGTAARGHKTAPLPCGTGS